MTGPDAADPLIVEVTRGAMVESRHRVIVAAIDVGGRVVRAAGDIDRVVYARSAIKPLQTLALVESGAADAFDVEDEELALAAASHSGETRHVDAVRRWLARLGCSEADLECGPHPPVDEASARLLFASGATPAAVHNNCSGKHAGFITTALHLRAPVKGYSQSSHPVQRRIQHVLEETTGRDLGAAPRGIDGCGIPVIGIPLRCIALAMARFGRPEKLSGPLADAAERIRAAMAAHPLMVGGTGRFDSRVIAATGGRILTKVGAEGVYCATIPEAGVGIALKAEDGARRAAETAMAHLLEVLGLLTISETDNLADLIRPCVLNWAGTEVGTARTAPSR